MRIGELDITLEEWGSKYVVVALTAEEEPRLVARWSIGNRRTPRSRVVERVLTLFGELAAGGWIKGREPL